MDLSRSVSVLIRWSWLIILFGVVAGGVAFVISNTLPEKYESKAQVLVGSLTDTDLQQQLAYQELARVYSTIARSPVLLERVLADSGIDEDVDGLASRVTALARENENVIKITATAPTAEEAENLADHYADEIASLGQAIPGQAGIAEVIQPAVLPDDPAFPQVRLNTAIAVLLGLLAGSVVALLIAGPEKRKPAPGFPPQPPQPPQPPVPPATYRTR